MCELYPHFIQLTHPRKDSHPLYLLKQKVIHSFNPVSSFLIPHLFQVIKEADSSNELEEENKVTVNGNSLLSNGDSGNKKTFCLGADMELL